MGPLSGPDKIYGLLESQAVQLAGVDFNAKERNQADIVLVDTAKMPLEGLVRRLRRQYQVKAIIGPPSSDLAFQLIGQLESNKMVMISASASNPQLTFKNPWFFRLQPSDSLQSEVMSLFLLQILNKKRIAVLYSPDSYGRSLANNFSSSYQSAGGTILDKSPTDLSSESISHYFNHLQRKNNLDGLYLATNLLDSLQILEIIKKTPLANMTLVGSDAFSKFATQDQQQKLIDNLYYAAASFDQDQQTRIRNITRRYYQFFRTEPDIFAINAYDAAMIALYSIGDLYQNHPFLKRKVIREKLVENSFIGAGGDISFAADGEVKRGVAVYQIKNNTNQYINTFYIFKGELIKYLD